MPNVRELENALPVAPLKVLAMESAETIGRRVNNYLVEFRKNMKNTRQVNILIRKLLFCPVWILDLQSFCQQHLV